jgi:hypothetical protein
MGMAFPLIFVAFVAAAIGVAYLSYLAKKKRREGFALVATQLGMEYWPEDPFGLLSEPFALCNRGDGRGIENVIAGPYQSIDTKAFDYWYYEESTDAKGHTSRTYYRFDCVVVPIDAACSPLTIENENVLTRLADALSFHDIQFESEDFNRMFNVKSPEAKNRERLHRRADDAVPAQTGKGTAFEVMGDRLCAFGASSRPWRSSPYSGSRRRSWITSRASSTRSTRGRRRFHPRRGTTSKPRTRRGGRPATTPPILPPAERWLRPRRRAKLLNNSSKGP